MAPFVSGGEALFYEPRTGDPRHDEPRAFCMPSGFPSAFLGPYPIQMIQTPQYLVMQTEFMNVTRIIPLDGRPHKTDIEPTFYGEPVGRWEGDTLVIEGGTTSAGRSTIGTTRTRRSTGCTPRRCGRPSGCAGRTPTRFPTSSRWTTQDLHQAVVGPVGDEAPPRVGQDRALRDGVQREQPLRRREVPRVE